MGFPLRNAALKVQPRDCWRAAWNWVAWQDDFTCSADCDLPVLSQKERFRRFWREYSLLQGEPICQRDPIRKQLLHLYREPKEDAEAFACQLKEATRSNKKHFSLITKLNAFRCPDRFIASDSLNRQGLKEVCGKPPRDYREHLGWCRDMAEELCGSDFIETCFGKENRPFKDGHRAAFAMRVLDISLMREGGLR